MFVWGANWEGEVVGQITVDPTNPGGPSGPTTPTAFALPASPVQVAAGTDGDGSDGDNASAVVLANGTLAMWGSDGHGQLGDTNATGPAGIRHGQPVHRPVPEAALAWPSSPRRQRKVEDRAI